MAVLDVLNLNLGTEQNPNWVAHDLHDKRISTTAVTTATHLLATNAGVTAMNPITAANLVSLLGGVNNVNATRINYDFNQNGISNPTTHGNVYGWFDDNHVGNPLDTLGMIIDFNMSFQILFGYNNRKVLFRWRNGANWENFYIQASRNL